MFAHGIATLYAQMERKYYFRAEKINQKNWNLLFIWQIRLTFSDRFFFFCLILLKRHLQFELIVIRFIKN